METEKDAVNFDWEDWDPSRGNFTYHMLAGSMAGITEHTMMFPVDTIKTHLQCNRKCPDRGAQSTVIKMVRCEGFFRLWRGVSTMFLGCVPAHAVYFSVLEYLKVRLGANEGRHQVFGAAAAGGIATIFHDSLMTPMDVIKQRLQLGFYGGVSDCVRAVYRHEGISAFYRSFPTTLFMNIPYGCIMVATNESIKKWLRPDGKHSTFTYMISGCAAGAVAAAATTPLDVVKTRLQTQALNSSHLPRPPMSSHSLKGVMGSFLPPLGNLRHVAAVQPAVFHSDAATRCTKRCVEQPEVKLEYRGLVDAVQQIRSSEGMAGLLRGMVPRLLVLSPSVAISWTTYETAKSWLEKY